jgi:DNA-binding CsgD family transcriptional regulator
MARGIALLGIMQVRSAMGDVDETRRAALAAQPFLEAAGGLLHVSRLQQLLGFLELSLGNTEAAHRLIGPAVERRLRAGVQNPGLLYGIPDDVEALVALGRLEEADTTLRPFERSAQRLDHRWGLALGKRTRALILAASGRADDATRVLGEALEIHDDVPEPFERGRTLLVKGEVERRERRRGAATVSLRDALDIFEGLGAKLWAARTRKALSRVDRRKTRTELTETEQRLIALVSAGRTNREVAAELFMSPHTVDSHLRRIYRTVGVRSRAELAGRFPRDGLTIHENA